MPCSRLDSEAVRANMQASVRGNRSDSLPVAAPSHGGPATVTVAGEGRGCTYHDIGISHAGVSFWGLAWRARAVAGSAGTGTSHLGCDPGPGTRPGPGPVWARARPYVCWEKVKHWWKIVFHSQTEPLTLAGKRQELKEGGCLEILRDSYHNSERKSETAGGKAERR
jgi:hypothetical protein